MMTRIPADSSPKVDSWFGYFGEYIKTRAGVQDASDAVKCALKVTRDLADDLAVQGRCSELSGKVGMLRDALAIPEFLESVTDLGGNISDLTNAYQLPGTDPVREAKVALAARKLVRNGLGIACSGSESMMFFDKSQIFPLSEGVASTFEGVFWITAGVLDGWDIFDQVEESDHCYTQSKAAYDPRVRDYYQQRVELANIRLVKNITTVAMAALALVSLFFASLVAGVTAISTAMLGLSCVYIILKIASYFYQRTIDDQKKVMQYEMQGKV